MTEKQYDPTQPGARSARHRKLTPRAVSAIRILRHEHDVPVHDLADAFDVHRTTITRAAAGLTWKGQNR